jgi:hypothetical protein
MFPDYLALHQGHLHQILYLLSKESYQCSQRKLLPFNKHLSNGIILFDFPQNLVARQS